MPHTCEEELQESLQPSTQQKSQAHLAQTQQLPPQPATEGDAQAGVQAAEGPAATTAQPQPAGTADQFPEQKKRKKKRRHSTADELQEGSESAAVPLQRESKKEKKRKTHPEDTAESVLEQQQQPGEEDANRGSIVPSVAQEQGEAATEATFLGDTTYAGAMETG